MKSTACSMFLPSARPCTRRLCDGPHLVDRQIAGLHAVGGVELQGLQTLLLPPGLTGPGLPIALHVLLSHDRLRGIGSRVQRLLRSLKREYVPDLHSLLGSEAHAGEHCHICIIHSLRHRPSHILLSCSTYSSTFVYAQSVASMRTRLEIDAVATNGEPQCSLQVLHGMACLQAPEHEQACARSGACS